MAMFCDRCGTPLASGAQFCTSCGKAVAPGAVPPATPAVASPPQGRVRKHIHLLATLWLVNGVLRLAGVAWLMLFGGTFFPWLRGRIGPDAWPLGPGWGLDSLLSGGFFSLGIFLGFFGVLHLALAWGLFERQSWARILGLVLGILALLRFPFGTALGIYTLWVLAPEPSAREYDQLSHSGGQIHGAGFSANPR
ncbi:MAG TPA: zinc-ribbon domain-containing protein [Candidatus Acidoferrum sp.]|nr:zinc-ribbon domain-containing protein [Candidatus Acidoferrum sp.]